MMTPTSKRVVRMLETIPKFDTYSKYNVALERVFQDNCMKSLIKNLKEHKRAEVYSYFTEKEKNIPKNNKLYQIYGIENKKDDHEKNLLNDNQEIKIEDKENNESSRGVWRTSNTVVKRHKIENDPFRYNPNYNSIYKNIPSVKIGKPFHETAINTIHSNKNISFRNSNAFLTEITPTKRSNKKSKIEKEKTPSITEPSYSKIDNRNKSVSDKNNHSLRFSKYFERKFFEKEIGPTVSYIEPIDYSKTKKKTVDYKKMLSRDKNGLINVSSLHVPSFCHYNPNYELIENRTRNIFLGRDNIRDIINQNKKKYMVRKLWTSFNVTEDYKLVDNSKLNGDALKDLKF